MFKSLWTKNCGTHRLGALFCVLAVLGGIWVFIAGIRGTVARPVASSESGLAVLQAASPTPTMLASTAGDAAAAANDAKATSATAASPAAPADAGMTARDSAAAAGAGVAASDVCASAADRLQAAENSQLRALLAVCGASVVLAAIAGLIASRRKTVIKTGVDRESRKPYKLRAWEMLDRRQA